MANNRIRYKQLEFYMTCTLIADAALFLLYLIFAGLGITWLKIVLAVLAIVLSAGCLAFLYLSRELLRRRSLWMTAGAAAVILCIVASLLLNFPSPSAVKDSSDASSDSQTAYFSSESCL